MGCRPARQERQATNKKAANTNEGTTKYSGRVIVLLSPSVGSSADKSCSDERESFAL
jgi:hypothetical protein